MAHIVTAMKLDQWSFEKSVERPRSNTSDSQIPDEDKIRVEPDRPTGPEESAAVQAGYLSSEEELSSMDSDDELDDSFLDEEPEILEAQYLQTVAVNKGSLAVAVTVIQLGKPKVVSVPPKPPATKSQSLPPSPAIRPLGSAPKSITIRTPHLRRPSKLSHVVSRSESSPELPSPDSNITALPPLRPASVEPSSKLHEQEQGSHRREPQSSLSPPISKTARRLRNLSRSLSVVKNFAVEPMRKPATTDASEGRQTPEPSSYGLRSGERSPRSPRSDSSAERNSSIELSSSVSSASVETDPDDPCEGSLTKKWTKRKGVMSMMAL